jgi:plastocyanin
MNSKVILVIIVLALLGGGWYIMKGSSSTTPEVQPTAETTIPANSVEIKDFAFGPGTLTVKVGDTVTWTNKDITGHSATADDKSFDTGVLSQGESGTFTFTKAGTYGYHCTPHPNMKGTIIVE